MLKKLLIHFRKSIKLISLIAIALLIIAGVIIYFYKISYIVTINGEFVGYTDNKSKLQRKINDYIEQGNGKNVAFVQVDNLPEYEMCFLKRETKTSDDEIFDNIKNSGVTYYRYYAILENQEEKVYVSNFSDAEVIVNELKDKQSSNANSITISEKYETELKEMTSTTDAIAKLYVSKPKIVATSRSSSTGISTKTSYKKADLGITLIKPVSGIISSRFGAVSSIRSSRHTGLDIATNKGTPIAAAASGIVSFSGRKGSYGNMIIIDHGNGVQTYYGHCNTLIAKAGQTISQGQKIATVGSTGNSTGPHLHFEVRINGVAYNPQNYLY